MSKVVELKSLGQLDMLLATNRVVVVDFSADSWCVPCQRLSPHYQAASEQLDEAVLAKVDVDEHPEFAHQFSVMGVPTVLAFREQKLVGPVKGRTVIQLVNEISSI